MLEQFPGPRQAGVVVARHVNAREPNDEIRIGMVVVLFAERFFRFVGVDGRKQSGSGGVQIADEAFPQRFNQVRHLSPLSITRNTENPQTEKN